VSLVLLEAGAADLRSVLDRVVFLGGATIFLWITDPAAREVRATYDVDVVAEVITLCAYSRFQDELRASGLTEASESGVICRWRSASGLVIDVLPAEPALVGMGGRWLKATTDASVEHTLPSGSTIRVVPPPYLIATRSRRGPSRPGRACPRPGSDDSTIRIARRERIDLGEARVAFGDSRATRCARTDRFCG